MRKKNVNDSEVVSGVKFKALDVVILVLILTAVVGVYFRYNILDTLTGNKNLKDYVISFDITDVQYKTENYINIGDTVYYNNGEELGTLIEASDNTKNALIVYPAIISYVPEGGTLAEEVSYPDLTRIDAEGRMKSRGTYSTDRGFLLKGTAPIAVGDKLSVKTDLVSVEITITGITSVE